MNFGPWAYLEFRPYPVFHDKFFPPLSDIASLLADTSLLDLGLEVVGLVCSNIVAGNNRHYWLVECSQGRPQTAYDSLKGVQKITRELFRSLSVTGFTLDNRNWQKTSTQNRAVDFLSIEKVFFQHQELFQHPKGVFSAPGVFSASTVFYQHLRCFSSTRKRVFLQHQKGVF